MDKVKFNIHNVHYSVMDSSSGKYGTPVPIPGAVKFALEPKGDVSPFYADGILYYNSVNNNGYEGDLERAGNGCRNCPQMPPMSSGRTHSLTLQT